MVTLVSGGGFKGVGGFTSAAPGSLQFRGRGGYGGISGFRVEFSRNGPGPYEQLRDEAIAIRGASVEAVVRTTREVKELIRDFIDAHFTGSEIHGNNRRRVSNASAQEAFYDDLSSKGQYAGLVYSKFGKRDAGGFVDFLLLHMRGGTLKPRSGGWLRLENIGIAGAQSGYYPSSGSDIFFAKSKDGKKLFQLRRYRGASLSSRRGKVELIATLVRSITFPARLIGIDAIAARRPELFDGYFAEALQRQRSS